jgi:hypothetical protein
VEIRLRESPKNLPGMHRTDYACFSAYCYGFPYGFP